ncbi:PAS domain S-box protein [Chloroflexi bacterium TSY]|nr:PAS domain S-box protein [Chloroflexi bacterium TSY]
MATTHAQIAQTKATQSKTKSQRRSRRPTKADLEAELVALKEQLAQVQWQNSQLEAALELATEHAAAIEEELEQEKGDLETILEMTTEHSDTVEEELHERAEAAVLKSEQQLRMIVEATPAPVSISRLTDGEIIYANAMMGPLFGVSTEELLGRKTVDLYYDPTDRHIVMEMLQAKQQVDRYEVRFKRMDGTPVWVELFLRLLDFNDEPAVLATLHDITHLKEMNEASNRFVPQEYLGFLEKESIINIDLGDYVTGEMTVMFSDLRGFTTVSETMTPQENFAFINSYLGRVSPPIRQHNGFIIKYLGDGIHAVFPQGADDGVQAGIDKLEQVNAYNDYRRTKDRLPIAVGIGVNTGYMMVGMVGEQHRVQGDAFSDDVNLTARLEGLTKFYGISFIISHATYEKLANPERYCIRSLDKVQVKGRSKALDLYEVYDADLPAMRALKQETQADYEEALRLYYARDFDAAQIKLFNILQRNPRDKVAWHHLVNATRLADTGAPEGWTGVTVMTQK